MKSNESPAIAFRVVPASDWVRHVCGMSNSAGRGNAFHIPMTDWAVAQVARPATARKPTIRLAEIDGLLSRLAPPCPAPHLFASQ
jgi:hypothetical protein